MNIRSIASPGGLNLFAAILLLGCVSGNARDAQHEAEPRATIRTTNGAVLKGVPEFDTLEFQTAVGPVAASAGSLARVAFAPSSTSRTAVVEFRNGDRLSGSPRAKSIEIRSPYGHLEVPIDDIESLSFETSFLRLDARVVREGLVRYFPFDVDPMLDPGRIIPERILSRPGDQPLHAVAGKVGGALLCNGKSSFFASGTQPAVNASAITLAAWIRSVRSQYAPVVQFSSTCEKYGPHLSIQEDGAIYVNLWGRPGNDRIVRSPAGLVPVDEWSHLAATYDGDRCRVYLNGNLVADRSVGPLDLECDHPLLIGAFLGTDRRVVFDGLIDEARVYDRALSAAEICALRDLHETADQAPGGRSPVRTVPTAKKASPVRD